MAEQEPSILVTPPPGLAEATPPHPTTLNQTAPDTHNFIAAILDAARARADGSNRPYVTHAEIKSLVPALTLPNILQTLSDQNVEVRPQILPEDTTIPPEQIWQAAQQLAIDAAETTAANELGIAGFIQLSLHEMVENVNLLAKLPPPTKAELRELRLSGTTRVPWKKEPVTLSPPDADFVTCLAKAASTSRYPSEHLTSMKKAGYSQAEVKAHVQRLSGSPFYDTQLLQQVTKAHSHYCLLWAAIKNGNVAPSSKIITLLSEKIKFRADTVLGHNSGATDNYFWKELITREQKKGYTHRLYPVLTRSGFSTYAELFMFLADAHLIPGGPDTLAGKLRHITRVHDGVIINRSNQAAILGPIALKHSKKYFALVRKMIAKAAGRKELHAALVFNQEVVIAPEHIPVLTRVLRKAKIIGETNKTSAPEAATDWDGKDTIHLYMKTISRIDLIDGEKEVKLAKQMEAGITAAGRLAMGTTLNPEQREQLKAQVEQGKLAKKQMIEANFRLVVSIAKKYVGHGVSFMDLIQEGNLGLIKAVEKFEYQRGFKFSTYATWWIRQAVSRALSDQGRTVRVPVHMGERITQLSRVTRELVQKNGYQPTDEEIAAEMKISLRLLDRIRQASQHPLSLEMEVGKEKDSTLGDFIEDETNLAPDDSATHRLLQERIKDVLGSLTAREGRILQLRFGLQDGRSYTLEEVGQKFGVTRERIRQIEAKALSRLRHPRRSRRLRGFMAGPGQTPPRTMV